MRETWKTAIKGDFETGWRKALHAGWIDGYGVRYDGEPVSTRVLLSSCRFPTPSSKDSLEIIFRPDPNIYDGRLVECGLAAGVAQAGHEPELGQCGDCFRRDADEAGFRRRRHCRDYGGPGKVKAPVIVAPGHPDNSVTVHLGYGREFAGRVGSGAGFNAYLIRTSDAPFYATGSIKKVDGKWGVAITKSHYQDHRGNCGSASRARKQFARRRMRRSTSAASFATRRWTSTRRIRDLRTRAGHEKTDMGTSLFPNWEYTKDNAWGMSIDMNSCTGCNACIVSCYAENNIAVVGKQQVRIGRNMQWLRIDTYFEGDLAAPRGALPADGVPALRERSLRAGLPGGRDGAYAGRPEHDGLQPLRGHALLLEQLPVQGAALQLPALLRLRDGEPEADAQSGCFGAHRAA